MKVCDKCRATGHVTVTVTDGNTIDLCGEHYSEFLAWLAEQPAEESIDQPPQNSVRRRGRRPKEVTQ